MAKKYVYSTLTADNIYAGYVKGGADIPIVERSVHIKGGANVADKRLITPRGVATEVSADDLEFLLENSVFQMHVENGYVTFSDHKEDPEVVVASGMEGRDQASPLEPGDFEGQPGPQPADAQAVGLTPPAASVAASHPAARSPRRA